MSPGEGEDRVANRKETGGRAIGVLQLGLVFVVNVLVFAWLGRAADSALGANGAVTAASIIIGIVGSFVISGIALSRLWRQPDR
jgi:hypothetical protein